MTNIALYTLQEENECAQYFMWREENPGGTMEEAAFELNISRATLYRRFSRWQATGIWDKIEQQIMIPKRASLDAMVNKIVTAFPEGLQLLLAETLNPETKTSERRKNLEFLASNVVNPYFERMQQKGSEELEYVESEQNFSPTDIVSGATLSLRDELLLDTDEED
jgi:hypothetical protein